MGFKGRGSLPGSSEGGVISDRRGGREGWRGDLLDGRGGFLDGKCLDDADGFESRSHGSASIKGGARSNQPRLELGLTLPALHPVSSSATTSLTPQRNSGRKRKSGKPHLGIDCQKSL
jgi:hypothetical protein